MKSQLHIRNFRALLLLLLCLPVLSWSSTRDVTVSVLTELIPAEVEPGESYQIQYSSLESGYVIIYSLDRRGYLNLLFPLDPDLDGDGRVEPGQSYLLSGVHASVSPGQERIVTLFTRSHISIPDSRWEFLTRNPDDIRDINMRLTRQNSGLGNYSVNLLGVRYAWSAPESPQQFDQETARVVYYLHVNLGCSPYSRWHRPWYHHRWSSVNWGWGSYWTYGDPWYHDSWYASMGWYDPFYDPWYNPWYDPWYGSGWYDYGYNGYYHPHHHGNWAGGYSPPPPGDPGSRPGHLQRPHWQDPADPQTPQPRVTAVPMDKVVHQPETGSPGVRPQTGKSGYHTRDHSLSEVKPSSRENNTVREIKPSNRSNSPVGEKKPSSGKRDVKKKKSSRGSEAIKSIFSIFSGKRNEGQSSGSSSKSKKNGHYSSDSNTSESNSGSSSSKSRQKSASNSHSKKDKQKKSRQSGNRVTDKN